MADLKNPNIIKAKGFLFLALAIGSGALAVVEDRKWVEVILIAIAIWSGARFYYFLFYVLEKYVDPNQKYAGVLTMLQELLKAKK